MFVVFVAFNVPVRIGGFDLDKDEAVGLLNLSRDTPELSVFFRSGGGGCGELFDFASEAAVGA